MVVLAGCACSGSVEPGDVPEPVTEQEAQVATVTTVSELCFSVSPELSEAYPSFESAAVEAAARWGWGLRIDPACASSFVTEDNLDEGIGARHEGNPSVMWGGVSRIMLSSDLVAKRIITDLDDQAECVRRFRAYEALGEDARHKLLPYILTHEIGHVVLNNDWHSDDVASVLYYRAVDCHDPLPAASELAMAHQPATEYPALRP